jgi:AraC-like DNA-binding protein
MARQSDPIDEAMTGLRIAGSVLVRRTHLRPWAIAVPTERELQRVLKLPADTRVLPFHLARHGEFLVDDGSARPLRVREGEAILCLHGRPYRLFNGRAARTLRLEQAISAKASRSEPEPGGDATGLMCGVITLHAAPLNPLLGALPPLLHIPANDTACCPVLAGITQLLTLELQQERWAPFTTSRLMEAFFAESIRHYHRTKGAEATGWFAGLTDSRIARSIQLVHARPGHPWTVTSLAGRIGLSPSRFAARFRERCGESVMAYVARVRLDAACQILRDSDLSLSRIAEQVGYDSLPGFSRAFRKQLGKSPLKWRAALHA